jgi:hypothetical protein
VEVQADAEHEQDDADLRHLLRQVPVGDEPRRVRADDDAGQQVADDRREPQSLGDVPQDQRGRQPAGQRQDQVQVAVHPRPPNERLSGYHFTPPSNHRRADAAPLAPSAP